jgi:hypothetical protein
MDNFKWDDKLADEFRLFFKPNIYSDLPSVEQFKRSKEPKKEYEILSYKSEWSGTVFLTKDICVENRKYPNYKIHSVKRISDDTVWTIGKETNVGKIAKFDFIDNTLGVFTNHSIGITYDLSSLKAKEPLFTTEEELTSLDVVHYLCETGENICAHGQKERMLAWKRYKILKDAFNKSKL